MRKARAKKKLAKNGIYRRVKIKQEKVNVDTQADLEPQPTTASHEASQSNDVKFIKIQLESVPIVYTTRLDDMNVIHSLHHTEPDRFFEKIIAESRPQHKPKSSPRLIPCENRKMSYLQLTSRLHEVNTTIRRKAGWAKRRRNQKALEEKNKPQSVISDAPTNSTSKEDVTKKIKTFIASKERVTKKKSDNNDPKQTKFILSKYNYRTNYFALKNKNTNESDVYFFHNGLVTQHFIINNDLQNLYTPTVKNAELLYCCWYQREEYVMLIGRFLPPTMQKYLKRPHACEISQCNCCCRNAIESRNKARTLNDSIMKPVSDKSDATTAPTTSSSLANIIDIVPIIPTVSLEEMLNRIRNGHPPPTLILKALEYHPQEKQRSKLNQNINVLYKNVHIFFEYMDGSNDYYVLGAEGEIIQHLKNISESRVQEGLAKCKNSVHEKICCWQKRAMVLNSLKVMNMLTKPEYLKTPHNCPSDKCGCCCKPLIKCNKKANLKDITLPDIPNHSDNPFNKTPPLEFAFAKHEPSILDEAELVAGTPQYIKKEYDLPCHSNQSIATDDPIEKEQLAGVINEHSYNVICDNAKYLLQSKLDVFKNISVSVNDRGKVTAALKVPVTKLATNELKLLSEILTEAQIYVDKIKSKKFYSNPNVILNNITSSGTLTSNVSDAKPRNNTQQIEESKKNMLEKAYFYETMAACSESHDDYYVNSLQSFFKVQKLSRSIGKRRKLKKNNDESPAPVASEVPKKRRRQKRKESQTQRLEDEISLEHNSCQEEMNGRTSHEGFDPLAINEDNNLNSISNSIESITQSDLATSLLKDQLLNPKTDATLICAVQNDNNTPLKPDFPKPIDTTLIKNEISNYSMVEDEDETHVLTDNINCILGP